MNKPSSTKPFHPPGVLLAAMGLGVMAAAAAAISAPSMRRTPNPKEALCHESKSARPLPVTIDNIKPTR